MIAVSREQRVAGLAPVMLMWGELASIFEVRVCNMLGDLSRRWTALLKNPILTSDHGVSSRQIA